MAVKPKIKIRDFNFYYGPTKVLKGISMDVLPKHVTSIIGPSGCGKSTLLRCLNRMNDLIPSVKAEGLVEIDGQNINDPAIDVVITTGGTGITGRDVTPEAFDRVL